VSQEGALSGVGDTLGSDEPAVDWGKDVEESDKAVAEVNLAAMKANLDVPGLRLKRQDSGDSGSVIICIFMPNNMICNIFSLYIFTVSCLKASSFMICKVFP